MYCDHTAAERGQTQEEMDAPLTPDEEAEWGRAQEAAVAALPEEARRLLTTEEDT